MHRFELESREAAAVVTTTNTETIEITKTVQEMHMQLQGLQMRVRFGWFKIMASPFHRSCYYLKYLKNNNSEID